MTAPDLPKTNSATAKGGLICIFAELSLVSIFILGVVGWQWAGGDDRDELAQWFMAAAAAVTLIAAAAAAIFASGAFQVEVEREERAADDRRRAQAERFSGWCGQEEDEAVLHGEPILQYIADVIHLRNASELPVYGVHANIRVAGGPAIGTVNIGMVPPNAAPVPFYVPPAIAERIHAARAAARADAEELARQRITIESPFTLEVQLWFMDTAGRAWRRETDGTLVQVGEA